MILSSPWAQCSVVPSTKHISRPPLSHESTRREGILRCALRGWALCLRCCAQHARTVLRFDVLGGVLCVCSCARQERYVLRIIIRCRALRLRLLHPAGSLP